MAIGQRWIYIHITIAKKNPPWRPVCKSDNIYNICVAINLSISKGICPPSSSKRGGGGKHLSCQVSRQLRGEVCAVYGVHQRDVVPICTSDHPTVALLGFIKCFAAGILRFAIEHVGRCRDEVEHVEVRWSSSLPRPRGSRGWHFWDIDIS